MVARKPLEIVVPSLVCRPVIFCFLVVIAAAVVVAGDAAANGGGAY